jgi:SAM-dependent methyltransferase
MTAYGEDFYKESIASVDAAHIVLSAVPDGVKSESVVDLGAGVGAWLLAARALGASKVVGLEGAWVPLEQRLVDEDSFVEADFEDDLPDLGRFDLAICMEVVEHLTPASGAHAVKWLCRSAPVVLFSAAIPGQGGTNHINEAWPSYWAAQFDEQGFGVWDVVRPSIWNDERLPFWYRQNALLFVDRTAVTAGGLKGEASRSALDVVHPELWRKSVMRKTSERKYSALRKKILKYIRLTE